MPEVNDDILFFLCFGHEAWIFGVSVSGMVHGLVIPYSGDLFSCS